MNEHTYFDTGLDIKNTGGVSLRVTLPDGTVHENIEAHRLFPLTRKESYISLVDKDENEIGVIRDLGSLSRESAQTVIDALREYYLIPRIMKIYSITEKYGQVVFTVKTDHGRCEFEIRNRQADIKSTFDNRVLIIDSSDNRYEIPDITRLDKRSQKKLLPQL